MAGIDGGEARDRPLAVERVPPRGWGQIGDWDQVVAASAAPSVFLTRDWVRAWWDAFGDGLDPCLLRVTAREGGPTLGIVPLYRSRLRVGAHRLGLLGDLLVGSEYLGPAVSLGSEAEVAAATASRLAAGDVRWQLAELGGLREGDPAAAELERALRAGGARFDSEQHPCSAIELPDDFEDYLGGLSSKFRQGYRQRMNKLLRSCEVRFARTETEEELPAHLEVLFRLHQARWLEAGRPGAFADPRMRSFYLDVSRRLLRSGSLRFWQLEVDGEIRACQFGFVYGGRLHSLQEAYDSEFSKPGVGGLGVVLRGHAIRAAIEEGLREYDFLGAAEEHKLRWGASVSSVRKIRIARPGAAGRLAWLATVGAGSARESIKSRLPEPMLERLRAVRATRDRRRGRRR